MKIAVTGANGYLGRGVVKQLLDDGYDVVSTDIRHEQIDKRSKIVLGSIFEMDDPFESLDKPDVLLHMAWRDGFVHDSFNHISDLPLHALFLRKMIDSGVKQIAVIGSVHEIGYYEGCVDENTPCKPGSLYGISKNALRSIVELDCKKRDVVFQWLRGFYIIGNTPDGCSIFSKIVKAEISGEKTFPFTLGQNQHDFLMYDDFCRYVAKSVEQTTVSGIINICSGNPQRLCTVIERFISENGFKIKLNYGVYPERLYDSKRIWGDNSKINRILKNEK